MILHKDQQILLQNEFVFKTARSSGPGGQNVNKVNTKVELRLNIANSNVLTDKQKLILSEKLSNRINSENELIVVSQNSRSQLKNKQRAIEVCLYIIEKALKPNKKRVPTKPTKESKEKPLENKKKLSKLKQLRRRLF